MKTALVLPSVLVFTLTGCKASPKPVTASATAAQQAQVSPQPVPPEPKFGWREFHKETFELHPLQSKVFVFPKVTAKLRVAVHATSAIFGGVVSRDFLDNIERKHIVLRTEDFQRMPCSLMMVDRGEVTCKLEVDERMVYVVRDVRAEGTLAGGILGFLHRSNKLAEQAALPNKIEISLARWQCIENCKKP